ncbi:MAG: hypothetical protein HYZ68_01095 [Chloroflexi bacterium]|nr:hypothetical protein [Chloroflexota bacterium]
MVGGFLFILALNIALVYPLFNSAYTRYIASIESAFIADARFIAQNFPHLSWNPVWYSGFPFHLFYMPLLPFLIAALHGIAPDLSLSEAYRVVTGSFYVLNPAALYMLVYHLTRRPSSAFLAAWIYSVIPSLGYLFPEVGSVGAHLGYAPWRLVVLLLYGEGPHIAALTFVPLAGLAFLYALRHGQRRGYLATAVLISLIALTSTTALYGFALLALVLFISEAFQGHLARKLRVTVACALWAFGLSAFWYNLPFIAAALEFGGGGGLLANILVLVVIGLLMGVVLVRSLIDKPQGQALFIGLGATLLYGLAALAWYVGRITPFASRYIPEWEMSFALLLGTLFHAGSEALRDKELPFQRELRRGLFPVSALAITALSFNFLSQAWAITVGQADVEQTSEFQIARWLADHQDGERVYAAGTHAFWLNVLTDVPQLRGGADFAAVHPWWDHVDFQIRKGEDGELSVLWAKALNIRYLVVNTFESRAYFQVQYRDFSYPQKFEGLLPEIYDYNGDIVYEVPLAQPQMVQLVSLEDFARLPTIQSVLDRPALEAYVQAVERAPRGSLRWNSLSPDVILIRTPLEEGEGILVKQSYHPGWQAYQDGRPIPIHPDPVGFMVLSPQPGPEVSIELRHGRTLDEWVGYAITGLTLSALLASGLRSAARPRRRS